MSETNALEVIKYLTEDELKLMYGRLNRRYKLVDELPDVDSLEPADKNVIYVVKETVGNTVRYWPNVIDSDEWKPVGISQDVLDGKLDRVNAPEGHLVVSDENGDLVDADIMPGTFVALALDPSERIQPHATDLRKIWKAYQSGMPVILLDNRPDGSGLYAQLNAAGYTWAGGNHMAEYLADVDDDNRQCDGTIHGYCTELDGVVKFYEDDGHTVEIIPENGKLYCDDTVPDHDRVYLYNDGFVRALRFVQFSCNELIDDDPAWPSRRANRQVFYRMTEPYGSSSPDGFEVAYGESTADIHDQMVTGARIGEGKLLPVDDGVIVLPKSTAVNDGTLTITVGESEPVVFSANDSADRVVDIPVATDEVAGLVRITSDVDSDDPDAAITATAVLDELDSYVQKVDGATAGHIAELTPEGSMSDSGISGSDVSDAVDKKHSHSNKSTLDNITAAYTTEEQTKLSGIETGAKVNTIESISIKNTALQISNKNVDIPIATSEVDGLLPHEKFPLIPAAPLAGADRIYSFDDTNGTSWQTIVQEYVGNMILDQQGNPVTDEEGDIMYEEEAVPLWLSYKGVEFGARRAYDDHTGANIHDSIEARTTMAQVTTAIETALANYGGFRIVSLNQQGKPDVANPSTKVIYLTKEAGSSKTDPYTEWICTNTTGPVWEVIGETTPEINEMVGATASTAGTAGLVPAPAAGDQDKFLKGDGTWLELNLNSYVTESNIGDIVASLYSSSSTYTVNSYAIKDNKLYRCTTAIPQAEEWTPAHWTPAKTTDLFTGSAPGLIPSASVVDDKHILSANGSWLELEEVTDNDIDALFNGNIVTIGGREYPFVRIGDYYWMTENLDWKAPGISINPPPNTEPYQAKAAWYYVDEATNGVNGNKYGLLYNAHALDDVEFPTGWHIPTEAELLDLLLTAGGAAALMSTTSDWQASVTGTNTSGFTALPSGMYVYADNPDGPYYAGFNAYIMSSTLVDNGLYYKYLNIPDNTTSLSRVYRTCGSSVRLCKHV